MLNIRTKMIALTLALLFCHSVFAEQVLVNSVRTFSPDLTQDFEAIPEFTKTIVVREPSFLFINGHIDVINTSNQVVFVGFQVRINGRVLRGSKTGENIESLRERFYAAQIHGFSELAPGTYTIELEASAISESLSGRDRLAEIRADFNQVIYRVTPKTDNF